MNILFIHQNFPGQFPHLSAALAAAGHNVHALAIHKRAVPTGVLRHTYQVQKAASKETHTLLRDAEVKVLRGEACAKAMNELSKLGFTPDLVIANPAWGEALYVKDLFPNAKLVCLMEFFHGTAGGDFGFDPEFGKPTVNDHIRLRLRNLALTEALMSMDRGVTPTAWQASRMPEQFASKIDVIFDGINTDEVRPDASARFRWAPSGLDLGAGDPVVTYVSRTLEPYRGFHTFMRALPKVLRENPRAQVLIVGRDDKGYGAGPKGSTWRQKLLDEVGAQLDPGRVHFLGHLPYPQFVQLLQVSSAHVYLTYPFVLSWSCLEAMSTGCHVIGSRTPPVEEFIADGVNGTLVDFFNPDELADAIAKTLAARGNDLALRACARQTAILRCDLRRLCVPRWRAMLSQVMGRPV